MVVCSILEVLPRLAAGEDEGFVAALFVPAVLEDDWAERVFAIFDDLSIGQLA
jgi:hypothetical protein